MSFSRASVQPVRESQRSGPRCVLWHAGTGELPGELLSSLTRRIGHVTVCTDPFAALAEACLIQRDFRSSGSHARTAPGDRAEPNAGLGAAGAGVLLLVQPELLNDASAVVDAAELYAPAVVRWVYDRSSTPRLKPWAVRGSEGPPTPEVAIRTSHHRSPEDPVSALIGGVGTTWASPPVTPGAGSLLWSERSGRQPQGGNVNPGDSHDYRNRPPEVPAKSSLRFVDADRSRDHGSPRPPVPPSQRGREPTPTLTEEELRMLLGDDAVPNGWHSSGVSPSRTAPTRDHGQGRRDGGGEL